MKNRPITVPLHFLPAFELVAEHLSIRRAAEELHLTPSAVSQQVRALEEALGFALLRRATRAINLTPAGQEYATVVRATLGTYRHGERRLQRHHTRQTLRLSCDLYAAHELLIPELGSFRALHPQLELCIEASTRLADFARDDVDVALRFGRGPWPGLFSSVLCKTQAAVVCAPTLVKRERLRHARALARYPLITIRDQPDPWVLLANVLGISLPPERLAFDSYFATMRAAEKGLGLAIGLFPLTNSAVLERRLILPLELRIWTRACLRFVCRKEDAKLPVLLALRGWLEQRLGALPPLPETGPVRIVHEQ